MHRYGKFNKHQLATNSLMNIKSDRIGRPITSDLLVMMISRETLLFLKCIQSSYSSYLSNLETETAR